MSIGPYRRILAAVDFSEASQRALQHAMALANRTGAELHVVHVTPRLRPTVHWSAANRRAVAALQRESLTTARSGLRALASRGGMPRVHTRVAAGIAHERILAEAKKQRCDLVVVGARGQTLSERLLLGSTVERLLRKATIPVLVIPAPARPPRR